MSHDQRLQQSDGVPLDHTVVFIIDQPIEGQYTLTIREEADVTFSIPR